MVLVAAVEFARNLVTGTAGADAIRAAALNNKVRNNAVKRESVVKAALSKLDEIVNGARRVCMIELYVHVAFIGVDDCFFHGAKLTRKILFTAEAQR
jgi:hypothetical protein